MPYTKSQAQTGLGTTVSIGSTPVVIGEVTEAKQSGRQAKTDDVTNMESSAAEFIPTLIDSGTYDITFNRVSSDAGQVALEAAFSGLIVEPFVVTLPKTGTQTSTGDKYSFNALVEEIDYSISTDKKISGTAKLKVSGLVVLTVGS